MVAAGLINTCATEKHKDKMICIKSIQLLLFISTSLIRVKCFHVLPLTYLRVKDIKWTGCGFKWNKESKEALGGLFHFSLDQVSIKRSLGFGCLSLNVLLAEKTNYAIVGRIY